MDTVEVRRATLADMDDVATTLDLAFRDDPINVWLFPDPADRARLNPGFMRLFAELGFATGEVYVAAGGRGTAVWFPVDPGEQHDDDGGFLERAVAHCGPYAGRLRELMGTMQAHHPAGEPHLHLNFLAVRPEWHGHGIGAAMLRDRFRRLDAEGVPAYLEASTQRSARLYAREGFDRSGGFALPENGPELIPMWRKPR